MSTRFEILVFKLKSNILIDTWSMLKNSSAITILFSNTKINKPIKSIKALSKVLKIKGWKHYGGDYKA